MKYCQRGSQRRELKALGDNSPARAMLEVNTTLWTVQAASQFFGQLIISRHEACSECCS